MSLIYQLWRTDPAELRATLRGWREPLPAPRKIRRTNPFTGGLSDEESWDPSPDVPIKDESPIEMPFPTIDACVDVEGLEVLCTAISHANGGEAVRLPPALVGPYEGPWVYAIPSQVRDVLARLEQFDAAAEFWLAEEERDLAPEARAKASRPGQIRELADHLKEFAQFSRAAVAVGQQVYFYVSL